jgi:hypothetical protein
MKRIKAARRYEYLDEDSPEPEESDPPDRGPSLSASPLATPTSPPAAAAPGPASPPGRLRLGHESNDVVGRRIRAAISDYTIRCSHASEYLEQSKKLDVLDVLGCFTPINIF